MLFDLIYAVSVFTHLDLDLGRRWLADLHRILKPGGLLLFSVHGEAAWKGLPEEDVAELRRTGFLFKRSAKLHGILPDWYHTAFHRSFPHMQEMHSLHGTRSCSHPRNPT